jgi:hypothetical protein
MKTIEELTMTKTLPEVLAEVRKCTTEDEVKQVLWKNQSPALKMMFQYLWHPKSVFSFKELPDYKPDLGPVGMSPNNLFNEMRRLYIFMDSKKIPMKKKTELLIVLLESLHPTEAALVGMIFKHDLEIPLLTKELVLSLWPRVNIRADWMK